MIKNDFNELLDKHNTLRDKLGNKLKAIQEYKNTIRELMHEVYDEKDKLYLLNDELNKWSIVYPLDNRQGLNIDILKRVIEKKGE